MLLRGFATLNAHVHRDGSPSQPWCYGVSCSWLKEQTREASYSREVALSIGEGSFFFFFLSAFPLTPLWVAQGLPSSKSLLRFLLLFSFHFKVLGPMDSSCFPLEEPVAQQTSIMILGSGAGGNLSRNSPPNAQKLSPGMACLYLVTSMPFCYRALTLCQVMGCKLYLFLHLKLSVALGDRCQQLHLIGEKAESGRAGSSCPESLAELSLELRAVWFLRNGKAVEYVIRHFLD